MHRSLRSRRSALMSCNCSRCRCGKIARASMDDIPIRTPSKLAPRLVAITLETPFLNSVSATDSWGVQPQRSSLKYGNQATNRRWGLLPSDDLFWKLVDGLRMGRFGKYAEQMYSIFGWWNVWWEIGVTRFCALDLCKDDFCRTRVEFRQSREVSVFIG